jgi:hypothetical protein
VREYEIAADIPATDLYHIFLWPVRLSYWSPSLLLIAWYYFRYIILLMGLFAIYTGLLYNDVVSLSLKFWKSGWDFKELDGVAVGEPNGRVYPFGIDPAWHGADNALVFSNSLKMKMSVILGVIHVRRCFLVSVSPQNLTKTIDEFRYLSSSSKPHSLQTQLRHMGRISAPILVYGGDLW